MGTYRNIWGVFVVGFQGWGIGAVAVDILQSEELPVHLPLLQRLQQHLDRDTQEILLPSYHAAQHPKSKNSL